MAGGVDRTEMKRGVELRSMSRPPAGPKNRWGPRSAEELWSLRLEGVRRSTRAAGAAAACALGGKNLRRATPARELGRTRAGVGGEANGATPRRLRG
eukprot:6671584-Pyramimonas_sp.AAC.1